MFVDKVQLRLIAGKGGNGVVAWRREKYIPKGGPSGGDGGKGASIIIQADNHVYSLEDYRNIKIVRAKNGGQGGSNQKKGKDGQDKILKVPLGTIVKKISSNEVLYDLTEHGQQVTICSGGKGGKGNIHFKSSTNRAPNQCTEGTEGGEEEIELELKLIADVGLVGMPNAGKSTIISKLAKLPVKIAPYPFTTLTPNLGLVEFDDYSRILIADIPGIIKGAHHDKGLGLAFLKHIERTEVLVFVIDIAAQDQRDPLQDFLTLQNELKSYNPNLLQKPSLVVLNKIDDENSNEYCKQFKKSISLGNTPILETSAVNNINMDELKETIRELAQKKGKKF
ncbi:MAG: GTPase ObgE [Chlamydiota bacterium]|jgi:GTP-binding protein